MTWTWELTWSLKKIHNFKSGIILETYERLDRTYIEEPSELVELPDTTKIIQKFLPKQADIDKIVEVIQRKVLKGTH